MLLKWIINYEYKNNEKKRFTTYLYGHKIHNVKLSAAVLSSIKNLLPLNFSFLNIIT